MRARKIRIEEWFSWTVLIQFDVFSKYLQLHSHYDGDDPDALVTSQVEFKRQKVASGPPLPCGCNLVFITPDNFMCKLKLIVIAARRGNLMVIIHDRYELNLFGCHESPDKTQSSKTSAIQH